MARRARPVRMHPFCAPRHSDSTRRHVGQVQEQLCRRALYASADGLDAADHLLCEGAVCSRLCDRTQAVPRRQRCGVAQSSIAALGRDQRARPSQPSWCPCMWAVVWLIAAHIHAHPWADLRLYSTLHPTPYTLHPTSHTPHPTLYSLHHTLHHTLHLHTLHPTPVRAAQASPILGFVCQGQCW